MSDDEQEIGVRIRMLFSSALVSPTPCRLHTPPEISGEFVSLVSLSTPLFILL